MLVEFVYLEIVDGASDLAKDDFLDGESAAVFEEQNIADLKVTGIDPAARNNGISHFSRGDVVGPGAIFQILACNHPVGMVKGGVDPLSADKDFNQIADIVLNAGF